MRAKGIIASPGITIGTAYVYKEQTLSFEEQRVTTLEAELALFDQAVLESKQEIQDILEQTKTSMTEEHAEIFGAHLEILEDPSIIDETKNAVTTTNQTAAYSLQTVRDEIVALFASMDDAYMRERSNDILDVTNRIIKHLIGEETSTLKLANNTIIVANDLTPSFTATLDREKVVGFVTYAGGATSHTAIMARSMGIPAICGAKIEGQVKDGDLLIIDAQVGEVLINPSDEILANYQEEVAKLQEKEAYYKELLHVETKLSNGEAVLLQANIGNPSDVAKALENGAEGIGLFRSEFLFMDSKEAPSEEVQFEAYKSVLEQMQGKPVTIRTLDIGGDKEIPYLKMPKEENPFLGYRAIRICLQETELFKTQLRALLRASAYGKLKIMIPLITSVDELKQTKAIIAEQEVALKAEGHVIGAYEVGIMIETPASVFIADQLAAECDFFSIGTNDLIQYVLVVDRMNEKIANYYEPMHPAVLTAIGQVIEAGKKAGIEVSMCGEMAGDLQATEKLLALGLRSFSMSASAILKVKDIVLKNA
jgi:phosphoenolpyruvate-protein phosphotransferase (PTS system enzyme I)